MRYTIYLLLIVLMLGCKALTNHSSGSRNLNGLPLAAAHLQEGELYRARKVVQEYIDLNPNSRAAEAMMAHILNREISRHKELYEESVPEEWSGKDKELETQTWLERSRTLMSAKQYEQSLVAAEKVFIYDPDNIEASNLIDEIHTKAFKDGKEQSVLKGNMVQRELDERVLRYRDKARKRTEAGRFGEARLIVQKLLILAPNDPVGRELQDQIRLLQQGNIR